MEAEELIKAAMEAKEHAYVPYSHFRVGAALLTKSGKVYQGCNIENAGYSPTNCAERTAFFKAVYEGEREFAAIAINGDGDDYLYPCGMRHRVVCADRSWQNSASRIRFEFLFPKRMENIGSIRLGNCFRVHSQRTI